MFTQIGGGAASVYRQLGVETSVAQANPHDLVAMLFDGLLLHLGSARAHLQRGDIKAKCKHIVAAVRILEEGLTCALNLDQGGELAINLHRLYGYCVLRLTQANVRNDDAAMREVIGLMEPVANGWKQIGGISAPQMKAA